MRQASTVLKRQARENILTYDDYAEIPNDGKRHEVIHGEFFVSPAPRPRHQGAIGNLYRIVANYLMEHPIGKIYLSPIDLILSPTNVVQPDILYLSMEKVDFVTERGIEGPPSLVVEVLSSGTEKIDRGTKSRLYAEFGVPHYWLIDTEEKRLETFRLSKGQFRALSSFASKAEAHSDLFPDLTFCVTDLWA